MQLWYGWYAAGVDGFLQCVFAYSPLSCDYRMVKVDGFMQFCIIRCGVDQFTPVYNSDAVVS
jgi:hypothetical protein